MTGLTWKQRLLICLLEGISEGEPDLKESRVKRKEVGRRIRNIILLSIHCVSSGHFWNWFCLQGFCRRVWYFVHKEFLLNEIAHSKEQNREFAAMTLFGLGKGTQAPGPGDLAVAFCISRQMVHAFLLSWWLTAAEVVVDTVVYAHSNSAFWKITSSPSAVAVYSCS
jgi:hypothetical protein